MVCMEKGLNSLEMFYIDYLFMENKNLEGGFWIVQN